VVEVNRFLSERSTTLRNLAGRSVRFTFSAGEDAGSIRVDPERFIRRWSTSSPTPAMQCPVEAS